MREVVITINLPDAADQVDPIDVGNRVADYMLLAIGSVIALSDKDRAQLALGAWVASLNAYHAALGAKATLERCEVLVEAVKAAMIADGDVPGFIRLN